MNPLRTCLYIVSTILLTCSGLHTAFAQSPSCDLLISPGEGFIDGRDNAAGIGPGDTICLLPGSRSFLWIRYLQGTKDAPIVIMNTIGGVDLKNFYYGIKIDSCSHVKLSGKGVSFLEYGIRIHEIAGGGVSVEGLSTDIELEGLEISGTVFVGIFAKSDPDCQFNSTRDKYVLRNLSIHDNYIHHVGMEGMYIGSSFYEGKVINCNGIDTLVYPHVLKGVRVFNNRIEHTGWDGVQVASSDSGCYIYNNNISYDSDSAIYNQMSGIIVGGGSQCDCFNNSIINGKGGGINVFGLGNQSFYNNLIVNAGQTYPEAYPMISGFYFGNVVTLAGSRFLIANNTIIQPKDFGVHFANTQTTGNQAFNNLIIDPGQTFFDGSNLTTFNNYTSPNPDLDQFLDPLNGNFDLKPSSPAVNKAVSSALLDPAFDILNRNRPFAELSDMGAYECHDSSLLAIPEGNTRVKFDFSLETGENPEELILGFVLGDRSTVGLIVHSLTGTVLRTLEDSTVAPGSNRIPISIRGLENGVYLFTLSINETILTKKYQITR